MVIIVMNLDFLQCLQSFTLGTTFSKTIEIIEDSLVHTIGKLQLNLLSRNRHYDCKKITYKGRPWYH